MVLQNNRYSVSEIIVIAIGVCLIYLPAEHLGWGATIITLLGIFSCLSIIYVLVWIYKIKPLLLMDDKKKAIYIHIATLVIACFSLIYSSLLIIFKVGSDALIAGIAIITIVFLCTVIFFLFPWPSWMRKKSIEEGFKDQLL